MKIFLCFKCQSNKHNPLNFPSPTFSMIELIDKKCSQHSFSVSNLIELLPPRLESPIKASPSGSHTRRDGRLRQGKDELIPSKVGLVKRPRFGLFYKRPSTFFKKLSGMFLFWQLGETSLSKFSLGENGWSRFG